jgi:hypothetical protein
MAVITIVINIFLFGASAHFFFAKFYPNEYQMALLKTSFYVILMYSYAELFFKKAYNRPELLRLRDWVESMKDKSEIEIVKMDGSIVLTNKNDLHARELMRGDLIIFSDYEDSSTNTNAKINKVLYYDAHFPLDYNYDVCSFCFISTCVKLCGEEKSYQIKLVTESENYYIVGNRINRRLICYLLKKYYNVIWDPASAIYILDIIDHNIDIKSFSEKEEILLNEKDYDIISK